MFDQLSRKYEQTEKQGREEGVDATPFLARCAADNLRKDNADGWAETKTWP
jgi:hypothetical protein